ncbi:SPOR domain-containing protein [Pseudomonas gingeri]
MRRIAVMVAFVVLAGCGDGSGKQVEPAKAAAAPVVAAATTTGWDLLIKDDKSKALTDWTAWLIEHGFPFKILDDGRVIAGPFASKEIAEQKKAQLADKQNMDSEVVEHKAQP